MDIKELETRLKTFQFFNKLSAHLKELDKKDRHLFGREAYVGMRSVFFPPEGLTLAMLKKTLSEILEAIPQKEILPEESILKTVSLEDKMDELKKRLEKFMQFNFDEMKRQAKEKIEIIMSFLAMLELIKQGFMIFEQKKLFGNIELKKNGHE